MAHRWGPEIPVDLRARLEAARLDLLALFRSLDQRQLSAAEIPQPLLRQLLELDADFAEALWALDQLPIVSARLRKQLPPLLLSHSRPWKLLSAKFSTPMKPIAWYREKTPK